MRPGRAEEIRYRFFPSDGAESDVLTIYHPFTLTNISVKAAPLGCPIDFAEVLKTSQKSLE